MTDAEIMAIMPVTDRPGQILAFARALLASADQRLRQAVIAFLAKHDEIEPILTDIFATNLARTGRQYSGPNWATELAAMRDALAPASDAVLPRSGIKVSLATESDFLNVIASTEMDLHAAEKALRKYGRHLHGCASGLCDPLPCDCGFDAALAPPTDPGAR